MESSRRQSMDLTEEKDWGHKRNRPEESTTKNYGQELGKMYPLLRDRTDDSCGVKMSLSGDFDFNPPDLAELLAFTVDLEKDNISNLANEINIGFCKGQLEEANKSAKELGKILNEDPRLAVLLEEDFITSLVHFRADDQNPELQLHAATIIKSVVAYSPNREVVKKYITPSIVVNLVSSKARELQVQAIWLLRTIALGIPDHPQIKTILEEAFIPLISFVIDGPFNHESFRIGSLTLGAICLVHPHLPLDKLNLAVSTLTRLINYQSEEFYIEEVVPHACSGLAYLCDGKEAVVVEHENFEQLIDRLIVLMDSDDRSLIDGGLIALGSIVRWATDDYIELILKKDVLYSLEVLLREENMYFLMDACWILSNITARKESHIEDVIRCECIDSLVNVVQNYGMPKVKKEAACAILNAMSNAGPNQINFLRESCAKALWNFSEVFNDNSDMVRACLDALLKLKAMNVTYNDKLVGDVEFQKILLKLYGKPFRLAVDIEGLPKSKKLRTTSNIGDYDGGMGFILTYTLEESFDLQQCHEQISSIHNGNSGNVSGDTADIAEDDTEIDVPS